MVVFVHVTLKTEFCTYCFAALFKIKNIRWTSFLDLNFLLTCNFLVTACYSIQTTLISPTLFVIGQKRLSPLRKFMNIGVVNDTEYKYLYTKCGNSKLEGIVIWGVLVLTAKLISSPNPSPAIISLYITSCAFPFLAQWPSLVIITTYNYYFSFWCFIGRKKFIILTALYFLDFFCIWTCSHANLPIILHQSAYSLHISVSLEGCSFFFSHWFIRFLYTYLFIVHVAIIFS